MNKLHFITIAILAILISSMACSRIGINPLHYGEIETTHAPTANCPILPTSFKETYLIGTWVAEYNGGLGIDTLILKEDGKYKQIYNEPTTGFHYESNWQTWWVESRRVGYLWLHLEGMHRCDDLPEVCDQKGGGTSSRTIDNCEYVDVPQKGEIILVVTGANYYTPRGIILRQTRLAGSEWSYSFRLQQ